MRNIFGKKTGWIQTFKRHRFWPLNPRLKDIDIEDIAHSLSGAGRFTNHTIETYSTAQHSWLVSKLLEEWGAELWIQLQGLLHDGDEAYLPDLARPVKHQAFMAPYRKAGKKLQRFVFKRYGLPTAEHPLVKKADSYMLSVEAQQLFRGGPLRGWWRKIEKVEPFGISVWDRSHARVAFLERFDELRKQIAAEKLKKRV